MFQDISVRRLYPRCCNTPLNGTLGLGVHLECDVMKRRCRHLWAKLLLVGGVLKLEEGQRSAVAHFVEGVAVRTHLAKQLVRFTPGRNQWQPDDVLVELPGLLLVTRDIGVVMKSDGN